MKEEYKRALDRKADDLGATDYEWGFALKHLMLEEGGGTETEEEITEKAWRIIFYEYYPMLAIYMKETGVNYTNLQAWAYLLPIRILDLIAWKIVEGEEK